MRNGYFETSAERRAYYEKWDRFWNRPGNEVLSDIAVPGTREPVRPSNIIQLADYRLRHQPGRYKRI
jgi:hypothetical protein